MSENGIAQPPEGVGLEGLRSAAAGCRACELGEPATQTVFGEGPETARVVLVGEQPGDQEDRIGEPFVGPAGKLLDRALADAGIERRDAYVTNAVKHFRFTVKGKRRIHQTPGPEHLRACRPWLEAEFVVNLADTPEIRYLKLTIKLELTKEEYTEEVTKRMPQIRDSLLILFSSKEYASIRTVEGKMELRDEILQRLNTILKKGAVKAAYFTDFVAQ